MATILLIDDSQTILAVIQTWITGMGHKAVVASDGYNAAAVFAEHKPALVILDYQMPNASGTQVYQRIRALEGGGKVPVIFLSGEQPSELMFVVPAGDPVRFLQKPVEDKLFRATVAELLSPAPPAQQ